MRPEKLHALTGLRFLAAAMILVHHSVSLGISPPPYNWGSAVSLFFVLSGFILAFVYPRIESAAEIKAFYAVRVARLWPAHMVAIVLTAALFGLTFDTVLLANVTMMHAMVPAMPWYFSYSGPSWSISVEMVFYLLFPFLIYRWHRTWWWKVLLAAGVLAAMMVLGKLLALPDLTYDSASMHGLLYINPFARLLEFLSGMLACSVFLWVRPRLPNLGFVAFTAIEVLVFAGVAYCVMHYSVFQAIQDHVGHGVWSHWTPHTSNMLVFAALIFVLAFGGGLLSRILSLPALVLLGEISFSVYLIHQAVIFVWRDNVMVAGEPAYFGFAACVAVTLGLAYLIWRYVEMPCRNAVKRRLQQQRPNVSMVAPVSAACRKAAGEPDLVLGLASRDGEGC